MGYFQKSLSKTALIKFLGLIVFAAGALCLYRFTALQEFLTPQTLESILNASGFWAPAVFVALEAMAIALFVPTSIMVVLAAGLFGSYWGFLYAWIGAWIGAGCAFLVGRTLGREFVAAMIGDRLKKYDDAIEKNGFTAVLYIRLLNAPFTPMNYGLSLTKVHFKDFFLGTGLGVMVSVFAITFLSGMIRDAWISGRWSDLVSLKMLFGVVLYIFSFFIPLILKKLKARPK
ncbi:MAG: TVP38/TMEM64 family protein [Deltaproteobacteria bacterium]|nr:TVP38/TMEM64 family protein [Deltaproteobacteria bacterium]